MRLTTLGKSLAVVSVLALLVPRSSKADVSMTKHIKQTGTTSAEWTVVLRIKGLKMRIDSTVKGENRVSIYDLNDGKEYRLNPKQKEVIVVDLKSASERLIGGFSPDKLRRVIKETGRKREVSGMSCDEYTFDLQAPNTGPYGTVFVQHDKGTVCVSQTIAEGTEVTNFVLEARKRGYLLAATELSPSKSWIGPYFFGQEPNVMVLAVSSESRVDGPVMDIGAMTDFTHAETMSDIKSDSIADDEFQIPPDWKHKKRDF